MFFFFFGTIIKITNDFVYKTVSHSGAALSKGEEKAARQKKYQK